MAARQKNGRKKVTILHLKCCKKRPKTRKSNFFCIFFQKYLHISKKSIIFAPDLEIVLITTTKNSQNYEIS